MVREGDLRLVVRLLVIFPSVLAITLLTSHPHVLLLHVLSKGSLPGVGLVLKHTTHAKHGLFLRGKVLLLFAVSVLLSHVLAVLLVSPVALVLSIKHHSIVVHEILAFELTES